MALARVVSSRLLMTGGCSPLKQQETGAGEVLGRARLREDDSALEHREAVRRGRV